MWRNAALALALCAAALQSHRAGGAPAPSRCSPRCHAFGTCHAPLRRCDCPKGFAGADCSRHAAPSCVLDTDKHMDSGCMSVSTCACLLECEASGYLALETNVCFNTSFTPGAPTHIEEVLASPLLVYGSREVIEPGIFNTAALPRADAWAPTSGNDALFVPLAECPGACGHRGLCKKPPHGAPGAPRCNCFEGFGGPSCEKYEAEVLCAGQCSGRGRCLNGWCHCARGAYGADCGLSGEERETLSWDADGANASARARVDAAGAPLRPRIYVYELPPRFNAWFRVAAPDRNSGVQLHERLLASRYRTTDPEEADFFYVPVSPMGQQNHYNAVRAARWVATQYPYWARRRGADHLYTWPWDFGACWVGGHPLLNASIQLSHFGLDTLMQEYACDCPMCAPSYTRGKDIVIPDTFEVNFKAQAPMFRPAADAKLAPPPPERSTRLFFSGGITGPSRAALFAANLSGTGVRIVEGHVDLSQAMASSVFCIAAPGAGFGTRTVLAIVFGCIPVSFVDAVHEPYEDIIDYSAFAVRIPQEQLPQLVDVIAAFTPEQIAAKQAALACVARHFVWSSIHGALGDEDGSDDAFEVLMYALRRKLFAAERPEAFPLLGCGTGVPGAPAPLRKVCRYQHCGSTGPRHWPHGGAACAGGLERPC
jgi:hypothetical protein